MFNNEDANGKMNIQGNIRPMNRLRRGTTFCALVIKEDSCPQIKKSPQNESAGKIYMNPFSQVSGEKGGITSSSQKKSFLIERLLILDT